MNTNDMILHFEFDYSSVTNTDFSILHPRFINLSPNGRFMVMGNNEHLYHLDTFDPDKTWHHIIQLNCEHAIATDLGGLWIIKESLCLYIDAQGKYKQMLTGIDNKVIWGNDDWLFYLHSSDNYYVFHNFHSSTQQKHYFKHKVIHTWKQENNLRLVMANSKFNRLYIEEIDLNTGKVSRLDQLNFYNRHIDLYNISYDINMSNYPQHCYSWPMDNNMRYINLQPWNLTLDANGKIIDSSHHIPWQPIYLQAASDNPPCSKNQALLATLLALDGNLHSRSHFSEHFTSLINTYIDEHYVHVITSKWHKKIPLNQIGEVNEERLEKLLDDDEITVFFLTHFEGELPHCTSLFGRLLAIIDNKELRTIHAALIKSKKDTLWHYIHNLFLEEINDNGEIAEAIKSGEVDDMAEFLKCISHFDFLLDAVITGLTELKSNQHWPEIVQYLDATKFILPASLVKHLAKHDLLTHARKIDYLLSDVDTDAKENLLENISTLQLSARQCCQLIKQHKTKHGYISLVLKKAFKSNPHLIKNQALINLLNSLLLKDNKLNEFFIQSIQGENILNQVLEVADDSIPVLMLKKICMADSEDALTELLLHQGLESGTDWIGLTDFIITQKSEQIFIPLLHKFICDMNQIQSDLSMKFMIDRYQNSTTWHKDYFNLKPNQIKEVTNIETFINSVLDAINIFENKDQLAIATSLLSLWLRIGKEPIKEAQIMANTSAQSMMTAEAQLLSSKTSRSIYAASKLINQVKQLAVDECEFSSYAKKVLELAENTDNVISIEKKDVDMIFSGWIIPEF